MGVGILSGRRAGSARPIDSIDDGGVERLAVDARLTSGFVAEVNLDHADDDVLVYFAEDGSGTHRAANSDASGRLRIDLALFNGAAPSLDGGRLQTNATLQIADADVSTSNSVPVGQATASNLNAQIVGLLAHDDADTAANKPVKVGARAVAHGSNPAAVAAGDLSHLITNRHGITWVLGGHPNIITAEYNTTAAQTNDPMIDSIGAGTKIVVTSLQAFLDEATTVGVGFRIGFGTASVPAEGASGAVAVNGVVASHPGMVPGGGPVEGSGSGVQGIGGDGEELRITNDVPTGGKLTVVIKYFTIES